MRWRASRCCWPLRSIWPGASRAPGRPERAMLPAALWLLCTAATGAVEHATAPGQLEGRASPAETSSLQNLVDAAAPGATLVVPAGEYRGDLVIDRPLTLRGSGRPRLIGSGHGSVVRVRAADVT